MKKMLANVAKAATALSLFAAIISVGTMSCAGMYQPEVPEVLQK
ncbi:hypothetical protein SDC9_140008 [bioreactor metagenome]|uniref:Cyclic lactone autoinducer peptide n=1 Tax=bioreactor metagenome TaxID=1076179 RepID=A0A645DX10_9ZZZZ